MQKGCGMIRSLINLNLPVNLLTCSIYENDSFIFLFGGEYMDCPNSISNEIIRIPKIDYNSWKIITHERLPIPLARSQIYFNDTYLYLFGGIDSREKTPTDTICRATIAEPEIWLLLIYTLPQPAKNLGLKEVDEFIYLFDYDNNCIYQALKYDPEDWKIKT